ncbi:MAG: hypothetical protein A3G97_03070 [Candidatus Rokubacteria bacterium RIFCSPLOWO2_12_FULL_69_21]|nr:MAG: hypothetical protein A3G97_03070 [Candidatus Rokubacteria bacterium RIFCSPLOWO2_12_FULL_69_21]
MWIIEYLEHEERDAAAAWVKRRGVSPTVVLDTTGAVTESDRVAYTPTVFPIDRDGRVVGKALGNKSWTSAGGGRALIRALLAR